MTKGKWVIVAVVTLGAAAGTYWFIPKGPQEPPALPSQDYSVRNNRSSSRTSFSVKERLVPPLPAASQEALEAIRTLQRGPDPASRQAAVVTLTTEPSREGEEALLATFRNETDTKTRRLVANALVRLKDPEVDKILLKVLVTPTEDPVIRQNLAYAFGRRKEDTAVAALGEILSSNTSDKVLVEYVISALGSIDSSQAMEALVAYAEGADDQEDRLMAVRALHRQGRAPFPHWEKWATEDPSLAVRLTAVQALASLGDRRSRDVLISVLENDEDYGVRMRTLEALQRWKNDEPVRQVLRAALGKDPHERVRRRAAELLVVEGLAGAEK
jgi:HEAT repeat protein